MRSEGREALDFPRARPLPLLHFIHLILISLSNSQTSGPDQGMKNSPISAPHCWRRRAPTHHELPRSLGSPPPHSRRRRFVFNAPPRVCGTVRRRCCAQRPICMWCCQQRHCSTCAGELQARRGQTSWLQQSRRAPFPVLGVGVGGAEARHRRRCEPRRWQRQPLLQDLGHRAPAEWTPRPCWASQLSTCPNETHELAW